MLPHVQLALLELTAHWKELPALELARLVQLANTAAELDPVHQLIA